MEIFGFVGVPSIDHLSKKTVILISESAYLIWVLRCNITINGTSHTMEAITKCWTATINKRLQINRITAKKSTAPQPLKN
jgi:hypothetical protein